MRVTATTNVKSFFRLMLRICALALFIQTGSASPAFGASLTIGNDVVVEGGASSRLVVRDTLVAGRSLFTSVTATPAPGDWLGIQVFGSSFGTQFNNSIIEYAADAGLEIHGAGPFFNGFSSRKNSGAGIKLVSGASSTIDGAVIVDNSVGILTDGKARPTVQNSFISGNSLGFFNNDPTTIITSINNWWGHPTGPLDASNDTSTGGFFNPAGLGNPVSDAVNYTPWLLTIPIRSTAFSIVQGPVTESRDITLQLTCSTCAEYKASENPSFAGSSFQPFTGQPPFTLSSGDGVKTVYVQYRAATGNTGGDASASITLDTAGPSLAVTNPAAGSTITRPISIDVTASDPSGVATVEYYIDSLLVATRTTGSSSYAWDVTAAADGGHELAVLATDTRGHTTADVRTVTVSKAPPGAPVITSPAGGTQSGGTVGVAGNAEALISVSLFKNGLLVGQTTADSSGVFSFPTVTLTEGTNLLTTTASDRSGSSAPSTPVLVTLDTGPPAAPQLYSITASAGGNLQLNWVPASGEVPASYKLYRSASSFTAPAEAAQVGGTLVSTVYTDLPAADGVYYYGVTAVDAAGNESGLSPRMNAASDRTAPTATAALAPLPPAGPGSFAVTLLLSEPTASPPYLGIAPAGEVAAAVDLAKVTDTVWTGTYEVTSATPHGTASVVFSGKDLVGNRGSQITAGSSFAIDTRGPAGTLQFTPLRAVYRPGSVTVSLTLDEPAPLAPTLLFTSPSGSIAGIALTGSSAAWSGTLTITSAMGDGTGTFALSAVDGSGNLSTRLTGSAMTLDVTPPALPANMAAASAPAGQVRLTWNPVSGAASYTVYRSATTISLPATPLVTGLAAASYTDLPAGDGGYHYGATAVDPAGNESDLSSDVTGTSDRTAPGAPSGLGINLADTVVQLDWTAPGGEAAAGYNLYRDTSAITSTAGLTPVKTGILSPATTDVPTADATYHYATTALDAAGNEGLTSNDSSVVYSMSPPVIIVTGITNSQYSSSALTPLISIQSAGSVTQTILLDGLPYVSATPVTTEGTHLLHIEATDTHVPPRTTLRDITFTIDLTDPSVMVSNVTEGTLYETAVSPAVTVNDANLDTTLITLNGAPYGAGTPITTDGAKALRVEATDLAGRKTIVTVNFTLNTAPQLVSSFTVTATQGGSAILSWSASPAADIAGYHVYKNSTRLTTTPTSSLTYTDTSFDGNVLQSYEVSAVDTAVHESARLAANVPPVRIALQSYGRVIGADRILSKQFIESIATTIGNTYVSAVTISAISYELRDHLDRVAEIVQNGPVNLVSGGTITYEKIMPVGNGIVDYRTYNVTLTLPADPTVTVKRIANFNLNAYDPGRKVEVFNAPIIKGGMASIRLKIYNHGSVPIELLTSSGSQPTPDIYVLLKDQDGNVLAKGNLNQTGAGVLNYGSHALAQVGAGGSFLSAPVQFVVPSSAPDTVYIEGYVSKIYYHYQQADQIVAGDFSGFTTASLNQPAYTVTVGSDLSVYDQNTPVVLSGSAYDAISTSLKVPDVTVKIGIGVKGFDRYLSATTDSSGNYTITFTPLAGEAGNYSLWASHPVVYDKPIQALFTIHGLAFDPSAVNLRMSKNASFTMPVSIKNQGESALNALQFDIALGSGMTGTVDTAGSASSLAGGKATTVQLTLNAAVDAPDASSATVTVTNAEGISRTLPVSIALLPAVPTISTDPSYIDIGVSRNSPRVVTFKLKNVGNAPLRNIVIQPPTLPWIGLVTDTILPDIAPGASVDIGVNFRPGDSVAQGPQADRLIITSGNHVPYTLNLFATVSSTHKGSVAVQATDSLNKKVGAASVMIAHQLLDSAVLSGVTDTNGVIAFNDITEGMYNYKVQAPGHEVVVGTFEVVPDVVTPLNVFMNNVFVTFDWSVTPMSVTDKYTIKLNATFETQVPAPVLTIEPAYEKLELEIGSTYVGEYRVTNHGLVALDDVKINMAGAPGLRVEVLVTELPRIGAMETVIIPYRITVNPYKSPEPVDACSALPMTVNVGGTYTCAAGVPTWGGVTGTRTIIPRNTYDPLGLCDVGCDWCKCVPEAAQGMCECVKTKDPCTCAGLVGGEAATAACTCLSADDPAACAATAAANAAEQAVKDAIISLVPPLKAASEALELGKNIASCLLCVLEALPALPSSSVSAPPPGGGGYSYGGMGSIHGGGQGFSSVRVCR
ncbi:MAG: Ig-like domain-containing protein [Nitrospirota bacterium]